jgi:hypothetical protein
MFPVLVIIGSQRSPVIRPAGHLWIRISCCEYFFSRPRWILIDEWRIIALNVVFSANTVIMFRYTSLYIFIYHQAGISIRMIEFSSQHARESASILTAIAIAYGALKMLLYKYSPRTLRERRARSLVARFFFHQWERREARAPPRSASSSGELLSRVWRI